MNRILAVRGQVVPVVADAAHPPRPARATARSSTASRGSCARAGIERVWLTPDDVARVRGRPGRDRRGRAHRARPGQPVHEPPAEPAHPGDPRRASLARDGAARLRLQRRDPGRRDDRLRPRRPRRGAGRATRRRASSTSSWPTTTFDAPTAPPTAGTAEAGPSCAGRRPSTRSPRLVLDDVVDPDNAHHHDPARLARGDHRGRSSARPAIRRRPTGRSADAGPPDVTRSERDLVMALRAELAAIDPSRPCDRRGRGGRARAGRDRRARAGRRPARASGSRRGRARRRRAGGAVRLGAAADHCRMAWLRGRFLARGSLSLAGGRTHLEFVVDADEAPVAGAGGSPRSGCRRRGGSAAGAGVVTWKSAEAVGTFLRRIGAAGALLELEARQVSRALRGELNRVLNAESANLQRAVGAAGRQLDGDRGARRRRPAGRAAVRRPARRRGAARDARGDARPSSPSGSSSIARPSSGRSSGSSGCARRRGAERRRPAVRRPTPSLWHDPRDARRRSSPPTGRCTRPRPTPASWPRTIAARTA